jgi:hypothetical protein
MTTTDIDTILARLERLEAENAALRGRLDGGAPTASVGEIPAAGVSRRQLLRRAGAGAAALGVGTVLASATTLGRADRVRAADGDAVVAGQSVDASSTTTINMPAGFDDVFAVTTAGSGDAITASSIGGSAIRGVSTEGSGVIGIGNLYGGAFVGHAAQVLLAPAKASTHPRKGMTGSLFVDRSGRLWYCKGGANWKQLA